MNPSWRKQIFLFLGMLVILVMAFGAVLTAKPRRPPKLPQSWPPENPPVR